MNYNTKLLKCVCCGEATQAPRMRRMVHAKASMADVFRSLSNPGAQMPLEFECKHCGEWQTEHASGIRRAVHVVLRDSAGKFIKTISLRVDAASEKQLHDKVARLFYTAANYKVHTTPWNCIPEQHRCHYKNLDEIIQYTGAAA